MSQRPIALGLLLCEQPIIEERTHNVTLVNCFTRLVVESIPSEPRRFTVFAALTDGSGNITLEVAIQRLDTLEEVFHQSRDLTFLDPIQEVRFIFRVTQCVFPVAGAYQVNLLADGESIAQHRIEVRE